ncbi:efflux RND transporter periplasmic adaptor subunit [Corallincola spongiicola]|uniref:Efflux RND transporter periplasmic adaptor subunit n=1 Tax=Corallincola spongiicola TaxID=2520508 RepID=A0ABY1WPC5_9GAMM|nr:efflux RND transporter periplasmic adaptor subunit [Corallincola spongiicola]TAA45933.1 efflux RND transporter periplasmic adaptor subunit [Corallincola spongiicola]
MKRVLFIFIIVATIGSAVGYRWWSLNMAPVAAKKARGAVAVVVAPVKSVLLEDKVEALATAKANESVVITANETENIAAIYFEDGDQVKKGQLLVKLRDAEQVANLQLAEVALAEQEREYRRIADLVKNRTIAGSELDRIQSLIDAAKARIAAEQAKIDDRQIRAPFAGQLGFRLVSKGGLITPGTVITTLDDLATIKLDFTVPERFMTSLTKGSIVRAYSDAYPDQVFDAHVDTINPRVNPITRAITVRAQLKNQDLRLKPGMLLKLELIHDQRQSLVIPEAAIIALKDKHFVYVVDAENKVSQKQIEVGLRKPGIIEVVAGLSIDEQVITQGVLKIRSGATVTIQEETWREGGGA